MNDFQQDLKIDPDGLDVEWARQPRLALKYHEAVARSRSKMERLKQQFDVKHAEVSRRIRKNPEAHGMEKQTERAVELAVALDREIRELNDQLIDAKEELELLQAASRAIDHKRDALENLVRLHAASYFAGPTTPRDLRGEFEKMENTSRNDVIAKSREALQRRRTR